MKRPVVAAERPGGFGTVKPGKPALDMGSNIAQPPGKLKGIPALARGGKLGPSLPKIAKIPTIKPPKF